MSDIDLRPRRRLTSAESPEQVRDLLKQRYYEEFGSSIDRMPEGVHVAILAALDKFQFERYSRFVELLRTHPARAPRPHRRPWLSLVTH